MDAIARLRDLSARLDAIRTEAAALAIETDGMGGNPLAALDLSTEAVEQIIAAINPVERWTQALDPRTFHVTDMARDMPRVQAWGDALRAQEKQHARELGVEPETEGPPP